MCPHFPTLWVCETASSTRNFSPNSCFHWHRKSEEVAEPPTQLVLKELCQKLCSPGRNLLPLGKGELYSRENGKNDKTAHSFSRRAGAGGVCFWCCAGFLRQLMLLLGAAASAWRPQQGPCGAAVSQFRAFTAVSHWLPILGMFHCADDASKE